MNNTDKAEGGPFTRFDPEFPNDPSKKSCLDLAIVSRNLFPYVKQGLKSLNPRPNSLFCTNSWCPTSMQNLESVAQKMAVLLLS